MTGILIVLCVAAALAIHFKIVKPICAAFNITL
jgi:hypothetical protein